MADDFDLEPGTDDEISGAPDNEYSGAPDVEMPRKAKTPPRSRSPRWPLYVVGGCLLTCCLCCVLPWCVLIGTGVGVAAILSNSETTATDTQTFTVDPDVPLTLTVENPTPGTINVKRGSQDDEVTITYTKKAYGWSKNAAEKELTQVTVDTQQPADNEITVLVKTARSEDSVWAFANQVEMTITVPENVHLALTNSTGSINVRDVYVYSLDLQSNTGSITFDGRLRPDPGATFNLETDTGSITVSLPADVDTKLDAQADTGSVMVSDRFDHISDKNESHTGVGQSWSGILGDSAEDLPTLRLRTTTGSITVDTQR